MYYTQRFARSHTSDQSRLTAGNAGAITESFTEHEIGVHFNPHPLPAVESKMSNVT